MASNPAGGGQAPVDGYTGVVDDSAAHSKKKVGVVILVLIILIGLSVGLYFALHKSSSSTGKGKPGPPAGAPNVCPSMVDCDNGSYYSPAKKTCVKTSATCSESQACPSGTTCRNGACAPDSDCIKNGESFASLSSSCCAGLNSWTNAKGCNVCAPIGECGPGKPCTGADQVCQQKPGEAATCIGRPECNCNVDCAQLHLTGGGTYVCSSSGVCTTGTYGPPVGNSCVPQYGDCLFDDDCCSPSLTCNDQKTAGPNGVKIKICTCSGKVGTTCNQWPSNPQGLAVLKDLVKCTSTATCTAYAKANGLMPSDDTAPILYCSRKSEEENEEGECVPAMPCTTATECCSEAGANKNWACLGNNFKTEAGPSGTTVIDLENVGSVEGARYCSPRLYSWST